ncbi:low affinity immunoglobulin epsilon Fc receptor-like [Drosophila innubila]|uniref:low affinity immunoglobulin epsilon Fc receptor-like n=1 Tax=Drosophila innubila TaxID=198719 RepID=UPI00148E2151|nr:low affinity immunoglobulin epsilon Fc receptor-like [Drosophila innubila]
MKNRFIWLLVSMLLVQESKASCAEWKQLELNCGSYCFRVLLPVLDHVKDLQSQVNVFKNQSVSIKKLEYSKKFIQDEIDAYDKKMEDQRGMIELALLNYTKSNIKLNPNFLEQIQKIEHQLEKIEVLDTKLNQKLESQNNLTETNLQTENSDFVAKFKNIEELLKGKFLVEEKFEVQRNLTETSLQQQIDILNSSIDSIADSKSIQVLQEKLEAFQIKLDTQILDTLTQFQNIKGQIRNKTNAHNKNIEKILTGQRKVNEVKRVTARKPFKKIGSKYYYIEETEKVNWFAAVHKCLEYGGHLASIQNSVELSELLGHLKKFDYWIDINDLVTEGVFLSATTGLSPSYLNWHSGEPNNGENNEHCGELWFLNNMHKMNDAGCQGKRLFICESANL